MVIKFIIYEGTQYKVGSIKFTGTNIFNSRDLTNGLAMSRPSKEAN